MQKLKEHNLLPKEIIINEMERSIDFNGKMLLTNQEYGKELMIT